MTQIQLPVHFVDHRLEGLVSGKRRTPVHRFTVVGEAVATNGSYRTEPAFGDVHHLEHGFGMGLLLRGFVEGRFVVPRTIDVQGLLVDFCGVESGGQHQRRIHLATTVGGENVTAEIQQSVHQQHDGVFVTVAVASLGGVEERVSVAARTIGPADDPRQDPARRVRRKGAYQVADEVLGGSNVVIGRHAVETNEQIVNECSGTKEELLRVSSDDEILREQFQHLVASLQGSPEVIVRVSQIEEGRYAGADFLWPEVGHRDVAHVVADGAITEHGQCVVCSQDALLNGFRRLISAVERLDALDLFREAVQPEPDASVFEERVDFHRLQFASPPSIRSCISGHFGWATARFSGPWPAHVVHLSMMAVELRAFLPTHGAHPPADLNSDASLFLGVGQQPLCSTVEVDGKEGVGHWAHHPCCGFLRPSHAASYANGGAVLPPQT